MSYNTILATAPLTTQNYHLKMIGTSIGNSLIWDNGTNVGIGNTNTSYTLDVSGTGRFLTTSTTPLILQTTGGNCGIQILTSTTTHNWLVAAQYSAANTFEITPSTTVGGQTYSSPVFKITNGGAATFSSGLEINSSVANIVALTMSANSTGGVRQRFLNQAGSGVYNFQIGSNITTNNAFEIIPSTAADGTTFSTAVFKILNTGAATFSSSVTANSASLRASGALNMYVTDNSNYSYIQNSGATSGANNLGFYVSGANPDLFIKANGNVLIGTATAPSAIAVSDLLVIGKSGSASNAINFSNGSTTNWGYILAESGKMVLGSGSSSNITFETNAGSERMRITSGGNVGIGTASPLAPLQVNGNFRLYTSNGDGNELRGIFNVGGAADPLSFSMYKANATTIGTFITSDGTSYFNGGNVGIGNTGSSNTRLSINGTDQTSSNYALAVSGSSSLYIYVRNDGYLYSASAWSGSDKRLKENIIDLDNGLNKILGLKARKFDFIDGFKNQFGFIAQEVQEIIPDAVSVFQEEEQLLAIKMDFIIPHLVKAIQEMNTKLDEQNQTIQNLQEQINILAK